MDADESNPFDFRAQDPERNFYRANEGYYREWMERESQLMSPKDRAYWLADLKSQTFDPRTRDWNNPSGRARRYCEMGVAVLEAEVERRRPKTVIADTGNAPSSLTELQEGETTSSPPREPESHEKRALERPVAPLAKSKAIKNPQREARPTDPDTIKRRAIVKQNPELTAEGLCEMFDFYNIPLPKKTKEAGTWVRAYKIPVLRHCIDSLIYRDRKVV